ncbi:MULTISPECIES: IS66 family insertion sequence element accessory protein TnpB [unclassified Variovorax]|uniref:IS66 family insertion sequence element accessory protein TnpB n=1 Tax=unclassified Variovorax TaxID=663243 RepID=UPI0033656D99
MSASPYCLKGSIFSGNQQRVVQAFGSTKPHHAYLFANRRANRMKVLVHDGIGIWLCARRHRWLPT